MRLFGRARQLTERLVREPVTRPNTVSGGVSVGCQVGISRSRDSVSVNSTAVAASGLWLTRATRFLRGDHVFAQLIRFAMVGGSSNIAYVLLFMAANGFGPLVANIAGSIVSTAIANELHRHLTFHAADRVGWFTAQWEGGGLALIGLLISTAALACLESAAPALGEFAQATAVLTIMAAVGGIRFLALRGFVF
ncbi:GtrA-like protein [Nocardia amikacinitolerans]|nr:GtrA-like protein [Nocardia amikacinitolerans]